MRGQLVARHLSGTPRSALQRNPNACAACHYLMCCREACLPCSLAKWSGPVTRRSLSESSGIWHDATLGGMQRSRRAYLDMHAAGIEVRHKLDTTANVRRELTLGLAVTSVGVSPLSSCPRGGRRAPVKVKCRDARGRSPSGRGFAFGRVLSSWVLAARAREGELRKSGRDTLGDARRTFAPQGRPRRASWHQCH